MDARRAGQGSMSEEALEACQELGLRTVTGECPMMFLSDTGFIHRLHGLGKKLVGSYPEHG